MRQKPIVDFMTPERRLVVAADASGHRIANEFGWAFYMDPSGERADRCVLFEAVRTEALDRGYNASDAYAIADRARQAANL